MGYWSILYCRKIYNVLRDTNILTKIIYIKLRNDFFNNNTYDELKLNRKSVNKKAVIDRSYYASINDQTKNKIIKRAISVSNANKKVIFENRY